jgi:hypothetical protein
LRRSALDEVIRSRALVFDEMASRQRAVGRWQDPANAPLWNTLSEARQRLSRLVVQGPESFSGRNYAEALRRARLENEAAERALAEQSAAFHSQQAREAAGLDKVAAALSPGDALVSYVRTAQGYAAFVERPGRETQLIRLGSASRVEALVAEVRKQVLAEAEHPGVSPKRSEALYRMAGDLLRRQVWDPLEASLARSRRIFLTPAGALNLVDFGALPARTEGYVAEQAGAALSFGGAGRGRGTGVEIGKRPCGIRRSLGQRTGAGDEFGGDGVARGFDAVPELRLDALRGAAGIGG